MKEKKCAIFCNQENHALNHKIIKRMANISVFFDWHIYKPQRIAALAEEYPNYLVHFQ